MKATTWEFNNRALVFGLIFGCSFPLYAIDHQNAAAALGSWLGPKAGVDGDALARAIFGLGGLLLIVAALLRTWASAYLQAQVVYAREVKTHSLVADGPYRHVRNPLYLGNIPMVVGVGLLMSRLGFVVAVMAMVVFCFRLIGREEAELEATQGERYREYLKAVPRLWFAVRARIRSAGNRANWGAGFRAEAWVWGFAATIIVFAITLNLKIYFAMLGLSFLLFLTSSSLLKGKSSST
jgi:protein-S-isoprenylcysteine O-methyltransferase Ste14